MNEIEELVNEIGELESGAEKIGNVVEARVEADADAGEPDADESVQFASGIDHIAGMFPVVHKEVIASNRSPLAEVVRRLVHCCSHLDFHFRCDSSLERRQCLHYWGSNCYWKCDWGRLEIESRGNQSHCRQHFGSRLTILRKHLAWRYDHHPLDHPFPREKLLLYFLCQNKLDCVNYLFFKVGHFKESLVIYIEKFENT